MARRRAADPRYDLRGGVNSAYPEDLVDTSELRRAENVRTRRGIITPRRGSKRIHNSVIAAGAAVLGLAQWDAPAGREVVAIAGGNLYHKREADADFTAVVSDFSLTRRCRFTTHRIGAAIVLYIADGDKLRKWDGVNLTAVAGAPAAADIAVYKGRLFAHEASKRLFASAVSDPTAWSVAEGGEFADVETFDTEPLVGLASVGAALALAKANSVARFTGVDQADLQIDKNTTGIAPDAGCVATTSLVEFEREAFGLSDRGAFVMSEGELDLGVSDKTLDQFEAANKATWDQAVAVHHRARRELWLWFPSAASAQNDQGWCLHYDDRAWSGPWLGMPASAACAYERTDGTEAVLRGTYDGWVVEEDVAGATLDNIHRDGSGGTAIACAWTYPQLLFGDPTRVKSFRVAQDVQADLGAAGQLTVTVTSADLAAPVAVTLATKGAGVRAYSFKLFAKGIRPTVAMSATAAQFVQVNAFVPVGLLGRRA